MRTASALLLLALLLLPSCGGGSSGGSGAAGEIHLLSAGATIIDNGQPGTASTGTWTRSTASGSFGVDSRITTVSGSSHTWTATLPTGRYEVLAWWSARSGRSRFARLEVAGAVHTINQRLNGGQWNLIGVYQLSGASTVRVTATEGAYSTCADAIAWNPAALTPPGAEIVIDDGEQGTSRSGTWAKSGGPSPYGTQSLYANKAGAWYSWQREIVEPGTYDVEVWWTEWNSRERVVPYEVAAAAGAVLVTRDQFTGGGRWQLLGRFDFADLVKVTVRVPGSKTVCADAVRFRPVVGGPPPLTDRELAWDAPELNADGTACLDLEGFKLAWGEDLDALGEPEDLGMALAATIRDLVPGTYFAIVTAYDDDGNESAPSALEFTVP